jgi:hypothetical protein
MDTKSSQPPLRGQTLPIPFTLGFMLACLDNFGGSGGVPSILAYAFLPWFADIAAMPLYNYYRRAHAEEYLPLEPVDYWYLSQLRESIIYNYGTPQFDKTLRRLGQTWWASGYRFMDRRHAAYNLQHLIGPAIIQAFHQPDIDLSAAEAYYPLTPHQKDHYLIRQACYVLAQQLQVQGGISCSVHIDETSTSLTFDVCPFCDNTLSSCTILLGVLQGMLCWLWGADPSVLLKGTTLFSEGGTELLRVMAIGNDSHRIHVSIPLS